MAEAIQQGITHSSHPKGLWCLSATSALYCFAFGTINSLLILYLLKSLNLPTEQANNLFAAANSLLFTLPLAGGYLAGKFGYKNSMLVGAFVVLIGALLLSAHNITMMYLGLSAFVVGNGLFTPASFALVGLCYYKHDRLRDSGYTIFYLMFNIGFLVSTFSGGFLATYLGYNKAFIFAAAAIILAIIVFSLTRRHIQPASGQSMVPQLKLKVWQLIASLVAAVIIGLPICIFLLMHVQANNALLWLLAIVATLSIIYIAMRQQDHLMRWKLIAFLMLCIISVAFWALYTLEPSLLTEFIDHNVNRHVLDFTIPPSTYYSLDALFVIILGIFFSWLWKYLDQKGKNISLPAKFASSLISMAIGYLIFVLGISFSNASGLASSGWIVLGYIFLASAELLISPIGLAMVGRLLPQGYDGLGMGVWQLFTGLAAIISGYLANLAVVPSAGTALQTNPIFAHVLLMIGGGTLIIGIIVCFFVPLIKRLVSSTNIK